MPWEVLCLLWRYDPVTTDPFGERRRSLSHPIRTVGAWQIYGRRNTRALENRERWICRRTSPDTSTVRDASRSRSRPRPTLRVGWEVRPSVSVSQNGDRSEVLLAIQRSLRLRHPPARPQRPDAEVGGAKPLAHLSAVSSLTSVRIRCSPASGATSSCSQTSASAWLEDEHRELEGLREIVRLAGAMNPSGKRGYRAGSDPPRPRSRDEGIVCPAGNSGI